MNVFNADVKGKKKMFVTELKGKAILTNGGDELGIIDNFVMDTVTGNILHILVQPADGIDTAAMQTDSQGRIVLPFTSFRAVKDVVVVEIPK
ncbi:MAG: PRC-barrel domain-containing protein [Thermoplasmata archaeon]|jgi:sporulation protein YlmC with PRC-barrel domain